MKQSIKYLIMVLILSIFTTTALATATPPIFNSAMSDCEQVIVNFESPDYTDVVFRVEAGGIAVSNEFTIAHAFPRETRTLAIPLNTPQPDGTVLQIRWRYSYSSLWNNFGTSFACEADEEISVINMMPWELFGGHDAYLSASFVGDENGEPVMNLLAIDNESNGLLLFSITASQLEENYPCTGETYTIFESEDSLHYLIRQGNCNLQILVGPDFENKMHYVIINGIPPTEAQSDTYFLRNEAKKFLFSRFLIGE